MNHLPRNFKLYLESQKASPATIKNYLSDFNHFWGWLALTLKGKSIVFDPSSPATFIAQITPQIIKDYRDFLAEKKVPTKTVNRRLSTLRKFGQFCFSQGWLKTNPAKKVLNLSLVKKEKGTSSEKIINRFEDHLIREKASPATVKNYLSDLRHFLGWLEAV